VRATFIEGVAAAKNEPNELAQLATKITVAQQIKNLVASLFKLAIQYTIEIKMNGNIIYLGN